MPEKLKNYRNKIIQGDVLEILKKLPDSIIQTIITSPPYWGLRDYGTAEWEGGDRNCDHKTARSNGDDIKPNDKQKTSMASRPNIQIICKCGAVRIDNQLGLEKTPEEYIEKMVEIFREVRRIMRDDGTLWLNLGDSYAGSGGSSGHTSETLNAGRKTSVYGAVANAGYVPPGLKTKDLCGIPWRVALALQADGWWLRSDIIWSKPNPMPESCTDRPTKTHEYLFLLTKSGNSQYWTHRDKNGTRKKPKPDYRWIDQDTKKEIAQKPDGWSLKNKMGWNRINLWQGHDYYYDADAISEKSDEAENNYRNKLRQNKDYNLKEPYKDNLPIPQANGFRNARTLWNIPTKPYYEAHFATFPEELVRRCMLAGSAEQACGVCGAPWERIIDYKANYGRRELAHVPNNEPSKVDSSEWKPPKRDTLGFRPTCEHDNGEGRCIVSDPFMGAGTVALVALKGKRDFTGSELNPDYIKMAEKRIESHLKQELLL